MSQFFKYSKLSFHRSLFFFGVGIFSIFMSAAFLYQYNREILFRKELLNNILQTYNYSILHNIEHNGPEKTDLNNIVESLTDYDLRITIMDLYGNVIMDNRKDEKSIFNNHTDRPEVLDALIKGEGYTVRYSNTLDEPFFYSAKKSDNYIIRSAIPYNISTKLYLSVDKSVIFFFVAMGALFIGMIFYFSFRLGNAISSLREFSKKAEMDELKDLDIKLPNNDIGEISGHIIKLYTKLNQTKQYLSLEKEKLLKHLQISKEGLAEFDKDRRCIFTNTLFIQYINLISDRGLNSPEGIFHIDELSRINYFLSIHQRSSESINKSEYWSESITVNKNGKTFHIECIIFQDKSFEISITNITQQEEETRLKKQLTQNVAHELKTPVSSIKGYLETILGNKNVTQEQMLQFIERCYAQTNRLSELLKDISVLNRIDEAGENFSTEDINMKNLVEEIFEDSEELIAEKNMSYDIIIPDNIVYKGNPMLIYSIFRNLLDNSIAYAGENKKITVKCYRQDKNALYFSFCDNGCGVEEQHLNRIFERFYRVDKGRSRKLGGTGLGLAIVKNAVLFHKGEIMVKNKPEGGLEFLFSLS